ncbi:hypothetical protein HMPREF9946_02563 [Acetobacteraceae bacterium AT-5844]|nr:hypothetical protein HMPREF9946_02563 [Acetobacteraceae bacterium AT-5844]
MAWSLTINGRTYTEDDFQPFAYVKNFPEIVRDIGAVAQAIATTQAQVDSLYGSLLSQTYPVVAVTGPVSLNLATHNGRILLVSGSGSISVPWSETGPGFSCLILNTRTTALPITPSGTTLRHPDGHSRIRVDGMAALVGTDGAPGRLQLIGQTEA